MCGFVGFTAVDFDEGVNRAIVKDMADRIIHRGPDDEGFFVNDDVAMGFRRLSIIDLEGSHQPMQNADGSVTVTFNGEIYNFQELRAELEGMGYQFKTNGDTETIVHGYEAWGTGVFERLRGMFAIAIWDAKEKQLVLARDIFGIKPLYYQHEGNRLIWGSEIKSFLAHPRFKKELNREALPQYLCFEYMNDSQTMFKDVHKMTPGHFMVFKDGKATIECFYKITYKIDRSKGLEEWADIIKDTFDESVRAHEIADVEIGSFLSGGIDSSLAAYCMGQHHDEGVKTFSVGYDITGSEEQRDKAENAGFKIKLDELKDAREFAEWAGLSKDVQVTAKEFLDIVPTEQYHMDEPLGAPSAIPLYFVSQLASKEVKVVQSGEGADELFGGYPMYLAGGHFDHYSHKVPRPVRKVLGTVAKHCPNFKGKNFLVRGAMEPYQRFMRANYVFQSAERQKFLKRPIASKVPEEYSKRYFNEVSNLDEPTQLQYVDMHTWMIYDILLKADRMSMANSLELRVPFLDKKMLELSTRIPSRYRAANETTKIALRGAAIKQLPERTANKKKLGFPVPLNDWLREDKYYNKVKAAFQSDIAEKFFVTSELIKLLDDHKNGKALNMQKIWSFYTFILWYEQFFVLN